MTRRKRILIKIEGPVTRTALVARLKKELAGEKASKVLTGPGEIDVVVQKKGLGSVKKKATGPASTDVNVQKQGHSPMKRARKNR